MNKTQVQVITLINQTGDNPELKILHFLNKTSSMMRFTQNWELLPLFPVCGGKQPPSLPIYTITYTSSPNTSPSPSQGASSHPTGPSTIPCCGSQDLQGTPISLPGCSLTHPTMWEGWPCLCSPQKALSPTALCLTRDSPPIRNKTKTENKIKASSCLLESTVQHLWWPEHSPVSEASILLSFQQVASMSGELAQASIIIKKYS